MVSLLISCSVSGPTNKASNYVSSVKVMLVPWKPGTPPGFLTSEPIPLDIGVLMAGRDLIYDKLRIHIKKEEEQGL